MRTLGEIIDGLGCENDLPDDALVMGAVVILHVVTEFGREEIVEIESEGLSWVTKRGLLTTALDSSASGLSSYMRDDGDD